MTVRVSAFLGDSACRAGPVRLLRVPVRSEDETAAAETRRPRTTHTRSAPAEERGIRER